MLGSKQYFSVDDDDDIQAQNAEELAQALREHTWSEWD
jgi:hypothetical protein